MPSNCLILCLSLLLLPSIFPSIRVFSNESVLCIRWPKCRSFSFSISPSNEYSGLISFRMDWLQKKLIKAFPSLTLIPHQVNDIFELGYQILKGINLNSQLQFGWVLHAKKKKKIRIHIGKHNFLVLYLYVRTLGDNPERYSVSWRALFPVKREVKAFCEPCVTEQLLQIFSCLSSCFQVNNAHKQFSYLLGLNSICCSET